MSDKLFIIPKIDRDLFIVSDNFYVEKQDEVDQSEVEANLNDYITNLSQWYDIYEYFPQFLYTITQPSSIAKETILQSVKSLTNGFSRLSENMLSTLPDFLSEETPDERVVINMNRIRSSLPAYLYLLSRLGTILESEIVKSTNVEKKNKNAKDTFYEDVVKARKQLILALEGLITRKEGNTSAIKLLYSPKSIPEGIPRIVAHYIVKLLSVPENGLARSEMRQFYPSFFHILGFMGFEWNVMKCMHLFCVIVTVQYLIRCATLSAMEAVVVYFLRQNTHVENQEFILKVFHEIQFFFWDPSSYVRVRAAAVVAHIVCENFLDDNNDVVGDKTKRRFSTDFYAYNFIEKYAILLTDSLVSVRKHAVMAINDILHRNPFGADLDYNKLIEKYHEIYDIREKIEDVPDNDDDVIAKLSERLGKFKSVVEEAVAEYLENGNFPEIYEEPPIEDNQISYYVELAEALEKAEDKKSVVFEAVKFCVQCGTFEADKHFSDEIVEYLLSRFHMRNLANMQIDNRAECIAEEHRLRVTRKKEELIRQEHDQLCAAQFALQMELCMKNAIIALKHGQMAEICEIVKFLAACRQFKLRKSESAVMQICSLIYRNDAEIREFVVTAGKNIFFSGNSNENVSEISTVQNLMQVMQHAKLEDRCVLSDTLVFIFESEHLKQGSLRFLWDTAEKNDFNLSTVAVQILQPYVKAVPAEGRKNFGRLCGMLKRKNDIYQVEVLQLAAFCGTVISAVTSKLNELVTPRLRIPSTDDFLQTAVKQLVQQIQIPRSKRWNQRAKLTFQVIYALCETPDEFCANVLGSILCKVKELNIQFRTFRHLYKESLKTLETLRKKLREKNVDIVPSYSTINDFELKYMQIDIDMEHVNNTQENIFDTTDLDTSAKDNVLISIDPLRPACYKGFRRFMNLKNRRMKRCTVSTNSKDLKWLQKNEQNFEFINRLKARGEVNIKHIPKIFEQSNDLFLKTRELHHEWHNLLRRLFFLTQQYIVRSIAFVHETMTEGLETLTTALSEVRKLPRGKVTMMNLPEWAGEHLNAFERDNLADLSIFKSNKGRIADATEQSVDSVISSQIEAAIGYDWFRPGSILVRIFPLLMQTIRFRSRPLISVALADSAVYCLIKYMLASPNLCRRNLSFIFYYLRNAKPETRSNIIIMLADIAIRHPSSFSKQIRHYLLLIYDNNPNVRYTSLLMIHYLYTVKAVQLPGQLRAHLCVLIVDQNQFISDMVKHFFHEVIVNHHIQISGVINDVLIRLYTLKTKDFDFIPIVEYFFGFIDTVKESDLTMTILCKHLVSAATYKEDEDDYDRIFSDLLIICMKLIPKISLNFVNTFDKNVEKFKVFLRRKQFRVLVLELVHSMHKRAHLKPEVKSEIDALRKHIEIARQSVVMSSKYDRTVLSTTRAETVEPQSNDNTVEQNFFNDTAQDEPMQID
uniref:Condensin complex subunit 1 C-terminal domain-containing protein n=1 Tax=Panagrolaimus sp. ES5 TaxID=591445 RepID=A0AC34FDK9_9BILA